VGFCGIDEEHSFSDEYRSHENMGTVILEKGKDRIKLYGAFLYERLIIKNDGIIKFEKGMYIPSLIINELDVFGDSILTFDGVVAEVSILDRGSRTWAYLNHIGIKIGGELRNTRWTLSDGYYHLDRIKTDAWTPVPEPTTYGAIFGAVGLGLVTFRRRFRAHRRSLARDEAQTPSVRALRSRAV